MLEIEARPTLGHDRSLFNHKFPSQDAMREVTPMMSLADALEEKVLYQILYLTNGQPRNCLCSYSGLAEHGKSRWRFISILDPKPLRLSYLQRQRFPSFHRALPLYPAAKRH